MNHQQPLLREGLTIQNRLANRCLRIIDLLLSFVVRKKQVDLPTSPRRILLANIANLGDVLIATKVIPALQKQFPGAQFGFLASSQGKEAAAADPSIAQVHIFDHFYLKSSFSEKWKALSSHFRTRSRARKEIRALHYDLAIDFQPYFPNAIPFLHRLGIPIIVGYTNGGFGALLTHPHSIGNHLNLYMGKIHLHLLYQAGIPLDLSQPLAPRTPMGTKVPFPSPYIVVHMGASKPQKEWSRKEWVALIQKLRAHYLIVLTGKGAKEQRECATVSEMTGALDCSDRLDWKQFASVIQNAQLLISVDSSAVHLAALSQTPCLVIFSGVNSPSLWVPKYATCKFLMQSPPCLNQSGNPSMGSIQKATANEVLEEAIQLLRITIPNIS